jgi:hypothetical protein
MKTQLRICVLAFFILLSGALISQQNPIDTNTYVIVKNNGVEYIGKILNDDGREILLETGTLGKIFIVKSEIKSITLVSSRKEVVFGEYRAQGPFTTRYQFTTNAFSIKRGENYAMVNLYGPEVHFSLSDRFSLGVMTTWIASPFVLAAKYAFKSKSENWHFALGSMLGTTGYLANFKGFGGLHWGVVTYGNRLNNISISAGYGYLKPGTKETIERVGTYVEPSFPITFERMIPLRKAPLISLAGIFKVGSKASLFFDSMVLFSSEKEIRSTIYGGFDPLTQLYTPVVNTISEERIFRTSFYLMPGMRFQKNENRAFQIALAGIASFDKYESNSVPIPMCSWFFKF